MVATPIERGAALLFFGAAFVFFANPIDAGDFWWHLLTGRWIWEHGTLPDADPFTYTVAHDRDPRRLLVLQGYWLSELALYLVQRLSGFAGIVVGRALFFTGLFWLLYKTVRANGIAALNALLIVAPLPFLCTRFVEARPQAVSFLASLLLFLLLERGLESLRSGRGAGLLRLSPLLMLLWANAHRGYLIGHVLLGTYLVAECYRYVAGRQALPSREFRAFLFWVAGAIAASFVNPRPGGAFLVTLRELDSPFLQSIDEFLPIWEYVRWNPSPLLLPGMLALLALALVVMAVAWRRLQWRHAFLFVGFAAMGLWSFRFSIFFVLFSVVLASAYLPQALRRARGGGRHLVTAGVALLSTLLVVSAVDSNPFPRTAVKTGVLPEAAVDFIVETRPPEPLFNPFEWGGYLGWRLHPDYRLFIDSRNLDVDVLERYLQAKEGGHRAVFEEDGINSALFYPVTPNSGKIPAVVLTLLVDERWNLVHVDDLAVLFVRAEKNPGIPSIPKGALVDALHSRAEAWRRERPHDARPFLMLGALSLAGGDVRSAREHFQAALDRDPGNPEARRLLSRIDALEPR